VSAKIASVIQAQGCSDTGVVRTSNQDRILLDEALGVYLIADGMGGHGHGEIAAELAVESAHQYVRASRESADVTWPFGFDVKRSTDENRLMTAFQLANHHVWRRTEETPEYAGMGTTLVGAIIRDGQLAVGNVGDSRIYLIRQGRMEQITTDDTWVGNLIRNGSLTEDQARTHSMRHVLTQAVGSARPVEVRTSLHPLEDGDRILLTTDGVHGVIEEDRLAALVSHPDFEHIVPGIIQAAHDQGAPDNASCILVRYSMDGQ